MKPNPYSGFRLSPEEIARNKYLTPQTPPSPDAPPDEPANHTTITGTHEIIPASTYAKGVEIIRTTATGHELVNGVYRPLTFRENILIRTEIGEKIIAANNGLERSKLEELLNAEDIFANYLDSCTGIAYKEGNNDEFKIIPVCEELIAIPEDFTKTYLPVNYAGIRGTNLKRNQSKYNTILTKAEALVHPGWTVALEGDEDLLRRYVDVIFTVKDQAMGFYLVNNPEADQVRALYANSLSSLSNADGDGSLGSGARFLRVSPNVAPRSGRRKK